VFATISLTSKKEAKITNSIGHQVGKSQKRLLTTKSLGSNSEKRVNNTSSICTEQPCVCPLFCDKCNESKVLKIHNRHQGIWNPILTLDASVCG